MLSDKRLKNIEKRLSNLESRVNQALYSNKDNYQWQNDEPWLRTQDQWIVDIIRNEPQYRYDPLTGNRIYQKPPFDDEKYCLLRAWYNCNIQPGQIVELMPTNMSTDHIASPVYFFIDLNKDADAMKKYVADGMFNTNKTYSSYSLLSLGLKINDAMNDEYHLSRVYKNMSELLNFRHENDQAILRELNAEKIRKDSKGAFVLSWRIASLAVGDYVTLACDDTVYYLHVYQDKMDFYHLIEIFTHEDLATDDKIEDLCGRLISNLKPTKQIVLVAWGHSIEEMNKMSRRNNNGKD